MELNFQNLLALIQQEWNNLEFNKWIPRIEKADKFVDKTKKHFRENMMSTHHLYYAGKLGEEDALNYAADLLLELSSFLFAAGAETKIWKKWSSLYTATRLLLQDLNEVL